MRQRFEDQAEELLNTKKMVQRPSMLERELHATQQAPALSRHLPEFATEMNPLSSVPSSMICIGP